MIVSVTVKHAKAACVQSQFNHGAILPHKTPLSLVFIRLLIRLMKLR